MHNVNVFICVYFALHSKCLYCLSLPNRDTCYYYCFGEQDRYRLSMAQIP